MSETTKTIRVLGALDSANALDIYRQATGELPPPIPTGCNSLTVRFAVGDKPAVLCKQKGFTPERGETYDDCNGYMALICDDAPSMAAGWDALDRFLDGLKGD